jgi:hypothetical protein
VGGTLLFSSLLCDDLMVVLVVLFIYLFIVRTLKLKINKKANGEA